MKKSALSLVGYTILFAVYGFNEAVVLKYIVYCWESILAIFVSPSQK